jgi:long-chain acyl-CoA synthetase
VIQFLFFLIIVIISFIVIALSALISINFSHAILRLIGRPVLKLFFSLEIEGEEYLERSGKMILAGTHTGVLDTVLLEIACKKPVIFLSAAWVPRWGFIGWLTRRYNVIPINYGKGKVALNQAIKQLKSGEIAAIFPEGTPTRTGKINRFRDGVAYIHKKSKAPIIPFVIYGGYEAWAWRPNKFPRFKKVIIQFGQPYCNFEDKCRVIAAQLEDRVQYMRDGIDEREQTKLNKIYQDDLLAIMQFKFDIYAPVKALSFFDKCKWKYLSYIELSRLSNNLSNYFIDQGIQKGDRIAILSESRPDWAIAFFASIKSGAIVVPLDIKLTLSELQALVSDCAPVIICASSKLADTAGNLKSQISSIKEVLIIDETKCDSEFMSVCNTKEHTGRNCSLDETALIVYTSGTMGNPKGVMITFGNIISQFKDFDIVFNFTEKESRMSILPLNHLLEITAGFLAMLYRGAQITYTTSLFPNEILKIMQEKKITLLVTVPLFLKIVKKEIERKVRKYDEFRQKLFYMAYYISRFIPVNWLKRILFHRIHSRFGGKLRYFICGGAPLGSDIAEFLFRIGIPVYQGYGLTETSPVISANTPGHNKIGSVGKPLPDVKVKISEDGEILVKGPNVMKGYYNRPDLTEEVIDKDEWFHTGDLGRMDRDGYLYVTGRLKNLIVLSGGNKVQPEEVEELLSKSSLIKDICILGVPVRSEAKQGTEKVIAVIVPTGEFQGSIQELKNKIIQEVNNLSQNLSVYKRPDKIVFRMEDFPRTTTGKIKRRFVLDWYNGQSESSGN